MNPSLFLGSLVVAGYVFSSSAAFATTHSSLFTSIGTQGCPPEGIRCADGRCILKKWRCDGQKDCRDGSDEEQCPQARCTEFQHNCDTTQCIPLEWRCDGTKDCADGSDELASNCLHKCPDKYWKCPSPSRPMCIPVHWKCDGQKDCQHGEDEEPGTCSSKGFSACNYGDFSCSNGECIPFSWRCDGGLDCEDGSDERLCAKSVPSSPIFVPATTMTSSDFPPVTTCKADGFFCILNNGSGGCLPLLQVCDHHLDCLNGTDEGFGCLSACKKDNGQCSDKCNPTPTGPQCSCSIGYELSSDGKACDDINECVANGFSLGGPCGHVCTNTRGSYKCTCGEGFSLELDGHSCKAEDPIPLIVYAVQDEIRWMSTDGNHQGALAKGGLTQIMVGVEWSQKGHNDTSTIFFSDAELKQIVRIDSITQQHTVLMDHLKMPEGIAYDWVNENLYYVDGEEGEIGVCAVSTNISFCSRITHSELIHPRCVAVHPGKRLLFFTQWGADAKIGRSWLDGSASHDVINNKIIWPNALTVDFIQERLYWIDARLDLIESATYYGEDRRTVVHLKAAHPFSLTILGNRLYWTDWTYTSVHSILTNGTDFKQIHNTTERPMGIVSIHSSRRPHFDSPCTPGQNPCGHICLARLVGSYTCLCQSGYSLQNGTKCILK